jgi:hypothetical protein
MNKSPCRKTPGEWSIRKAPNIFRPIISSVFVFGYQFREGLRVIWPSFRLATRVIGHTFMQYYKYGVSAIRLGGPSLSLGISTVAPLYGLLSLPLSFCAARFCLTSFWPASTFEVTETGQSSCLAVTYF